MKKYIPIISIILLSLTLLSIWFYPTGSTILSSISLLFSLAPALYSIFEKHKETESTRIKITKDVLIFIATFLLIAFLGGLTGLLANHYISNSFGAVVGLACAILAGFVVGYFVRKSVMKLTS
jgi:membrane associated rhomboid family serine protease